MKLIVGLGNIGKQYEKTRHNIGFMVADDLVKSFSSSWQEDKNAYFCQIYQPHKLLIIKPKTYMNLSGIAVGFFSEYYKINSEDIAVVQDDLDLPCGKIRIRKKGSAGGHNGIKSIIEHLGTQEFNRFKIGIGHPQNEHKQVISHVLEKFSKDESILIEDAIAKTQEALKFWLDRGIAATMNEYN